MITLDSKNYISRMHTKIVLTPMLSDLQGANALSVNILVPYIKNLFNIFQALCNIPRPVDQVCICVLPLTPKESFGLTGEVRTEMCIQTLGRK